MHALHMFSFSENPGEQCQYYQLPNFPLRKYMFNKTLGPSGDHSWGKVSEYFETINSKTWDTVYILFMNNNMDVYIQFPA